MCTTVAFREHHTGETQRPCWAAALCEEEPAELTKTQHPCVRRLGTGDNIIKYYIPFLAKGVAEMLHTGPLRRTTSSVIGNIKVFCPSDGGFSVGDVECVE